MSEAHFSLMMACHNFINSETGNLSRKILLLEEEKNEIYTVTMILKGLKVNHVGIYL